MKNQDFDTLMAGLDEAKAYAKGEVAAETVAHDIRVDGAFIAEMRAKAGLTQAELAAVTGASLGTVRKWERGERSPSGAARMLMRILARDPAIVIEAAGLAQPTRRKRADRAA